MALFSVADIITAIFLLVAIVDAVMRHDERESSKALTLTMIVSAVMMVLDSLSGFVYPASTPDVLLYITTVFSALTTKGIWLFFISIVISTSERRPASANGCLLCRWCWWQ